MTTYYDYLGRPMAVSAPSSVYVTGTSAGNETLYALPGPSSVSTNGGNYDVVVGSNGDNIYYVNSTDTVQVADGLTGVKTVFLWSGGYTLPDNVKNLTFAGAGYWGAGNDLDNLIIMNGNDRNTMDGGLGNDVLVGGFDQNTIQFEVGGGHDVVYNFHVERDQLRISGSSLTTFASMRSHMAQVGSDVVLTIDPANSITFRGVQVADFQAKNFLLPLDRSQLGALTFSDDFNSLQLWNAATGQGHWQTNFGGDPTKLDTYSITSNDEKQLYAAPGFVGEDGYDLSAYNPFSISGGVLDIQVRRISYVDSQHSWGQAYTSGMLNSRGLFMQKYGYFEMRAELPTALGTWPAFWLSQDPYKPGVEADVLEHLALYPDVNFGRVNNAGVVTGSTNYIPSLSGFHTYGMLWGPTNTTFYVDEVAVLQAPTPASWDKPMYMLLNMAIGGWGGEIDQSALPDHMKVDYVHVYGLANSPVSVAVGLPAYTAPTGVNAVTLIGSGQTVTANDQGDTLVGTGGSDVFVLGKGGDVVTGGGGADAVRINALPWTASHITDLAADDVLDLTGVLSAIGYTGSSAQSAGLLKVAAGADQSAQVWIKSGGQWTLLTTLDGVAVDQVSIQGSHVLTSVVPPQPPAPPAPDPQPPLASHATNADLNGDGMGDLFWQNMGNQLMSAWTVSNMKASGVNLPSASAGGWVAMDVGDFDGNGYSGDILFRNVNSGKMNIWLDTAGSYAGADVGQVTTDWNVMAAADFNGDGKSDILWRNEQNGYVSVWQMSGTTATGSYNPGQVGLNWKIVGASDYTGDGKADILWRDANSGEINLWTLDSQGQAHGARIANLPSGWAVAGSGDFNGDGKADILWRDSTTNQAVVWEMNGSTVLANQAIATLGSQWKVASVTDITGDGKADIIWRDTTSGQTVAWAMDGFNVSSQSVLGTVDNGWQIINHHFDWI